MPDDSLVTECDYCYRAAEHTLTSHRQSFLRRLFRAGRRYRHACPRHYLRAISDLR